MADHLSSQQVADYRQQRLAPAALIAVDDQLAACAACRRPVEAALPGAVIALYAGLRAVAETLSHVAQHLSFARMADYVDEKLAGEELQFVSDHLVACAVCAETVADLRSFKAEAATPINIGHPISAGARKEN
jgi:hypothetical protein